MAQNNNHRVLPGFRLGLSYTLIYLSAMVFIPLIACVIKASSISRAEFWATVSAPEAVAAYKFTLWSSFWAAGLSVIFGMLIAWVLVRYEFPGKKIMDSLIDLPFALPTAVAGLVYSNLYVKSGWLGQYLVPRGINAAYTPLAVVLVLTYLGAPFVVRALQPVLESMDAETEEASMLMGATRWQTFLWVILPTLTPALMTGFALSLARGIGEYGSVIFVSGNIPFQTQIAPVMIVSYLDGREYGRAAAIAVVLLAISFALLVAINLLERRSKRHYA